MGCEWDEEFCQSQRLDLYYTRAEEILEWGGAYICLCEAERFRETTLRREACPDRDLPAEEHLRRFSEMLQGGYGEGEAVMRIKTDLDHPNPAVRDWPAMRIIDAHRNPHPLTGTDRWVWPLYNFSCGVDDHELGITHIVRGKEHEVNETRQRFLYEHFGWEYPMAVHHGRIFIPDAVLSKSKMLEGEYEGPGDVRLATLKALRRRGFQPDTIRFVMHKVGLNPSKATIEWKNLEAYNRKRIDPVANRRFVILNPRVMRVENVDSEIEAVVPLHPDFPERGTREFRLEPKDDVVEIYLDEGDLGPGGESSRLRLKGLFNVAVEFDSRGDPVGRYIGGGVEAATEEEMPIVHWLPKDDVLKVVVVWTDNSELVGVGESGLSSESEGDLIQMERLGYGRIETVEDRVVQIVYAHR
jgi:glutamyl-tRNA synthetase